MGLPRYQLPAKVIRELIGLYDPGHSLLRIIRLISKRPLACLDCCNLFNAHGPGNVPALYYTFTANSPSGLVRLGSISCIKMGKQLA